jgi:uncharacterized protein (TIGR03435 family)
MQDAADMELLRQYVHRDSEEAFATLVRRHVNMVYCAALRKTGKPDAAEEITQAVFSILAKKAGGLREKTILSGWLYQTARLTAASFLRTEIRRIRREQEAYMQSLSNETESEVWPQITPLLEDAMGRLSERDRNAIVLRFFEGKSFQEIGTAVGASENAAKKRVAYALEKLRKYFSKRGVASTTAIIAGAISANSVHAAPVALAKSVTGVAIAKGASASGPTLTLIKGALKIMAWTKAKTAIVGGVGVLLAAGTTTVTVREIREHRTYSWEVPNFDTSVLDKAPPQVTIVPTKFPKGRWGMLGREGLPGVQMQQGGSANEKFKIMQYQIPNPEMNRLIGIDYPAEDILAAAEQWNMKTRMVLPVNLPKGKYDFIANLPSGAAEALKQAVKDKIGLIGKRETRQTEVLLLTVRNPGSTGLKPSTATAANQSEGGGPGGCLFVNVPISHLASFLEDSLGIPVLDHTGLAGNFDIKLKWRVDRAHKDHNTDALKQALLNELGLELVPSTEPIEMLVVEKTE